MLSTLIQEVCRFPLLTNGALQVVPGSENNLREGKKYGILIFLKKLFESIVRGSWVSSTLIVIQRRDCVDADLR